MGLLIFYRFKRQLYGTISVKYYSHYIDLFWKIAYGCAFLFMFIGFIYDIAMIIDGKIDRIDFPIVYFVVCFVYVILSIFDYIFKEKALHLIMRNLRDINGSIDSKKMN